MKKEIISAQVILFGKGRKPVDGRTLITSGNLISFIPREQSVTELNRIFSKNGFKVSSLFGISFSIAATADKFEEYFGARLYKEKNKTPGFILKRKKVGAELKNELLPDEIKKYVQAVIFTPPPDFGPTDW